MRTSDKTFNFTTRNVNKDKIIDEKWPSLFGLLEETNNTTKLYCVHIFSSTYNTKNKDERRFSSLGEYLDKVDRVMTQVDRITEDIAHMPVAAFIFRDKESDEVHYSTNIR